MHAARPCPPWLLCCMCSFGACFPYDSVLFSYLNENGCRIFSLLCRNTVFRSTSPPGIFPPTFPLFFLFLKAFSLRVRTTPQTFTQNYMLRDLPVYCGYVNIYSCHGFFFPLQFPHSIIGNIPTYATLHGTYLPSHESDARGVLYTLNLTPGGGRSYPEWLRWNLYSYEYLENQKPTRQTKKLYITLVRLRPSSS